MRTVGLRLNDLMGALGMPGGWAGAQADALAGNSVGMLKNLQDAAYEAQTGMATDRLGRILGSGGIPPSGQMPSPGQMFSVNGPICGCGYHGGYQRIDLAGGDPSKRFTAMKLEGLLKSSPEARQAFEAQIGGRIVSFGSTNGKMVIERFPQGAAPIPGMAQNPLANSALSSVYGMEQAMMKQAMKLGLITTGIGAGVGALGGLALGAATGNPLLGLLTGGLGGLLSGAGMGAGFLGGGGFPMMGGLGLGGFGANPLLGGGGMGSWNPNAMPGRINNTNPAYEGAHQAQVAGVLNDPSLSVEDKVTLMLMLIMKKMDKDIERQMQYVNSIQQQQSNRNKKGKGLGAIGTVAGGALGGPAGAKLGGGIGGKLGGQGGSSPSIDVETMKLKRMIDKRGQMFDMLRQIIDKYNETAKGIIQSIGR